MSLNGESEISISPFSMFIKFNEKHKEQIKTFHKASIHCANGSIILTTVRFFNKICPQNCDGNALVSRNQKVKEASRVQAGIPNRLQIFWQILEKIMV